MIHTPPDDDKPLDPAQQRLFDRMRRLMVFSIAGTGLAIALVLGVIGYRVFRVEGSRAAPEVTALVPKGARIMTTAVSGDRLVVTLEIAGKAEIRVFELTTLKPAGRLQFATEP